MTAVTRIAAAAANTETVRAGTLDELRERNVIMVQAPDRPVAVFYNDGQPAAVDHRCPHMGFPLSQGNLTGGILTCEWHHARFDVRSGCTFDLWADDIPAYDVTVTDGVVYVAVHPRQRPDRAYHLARLHRGLDRNLRLVIAKSLIGLLAEGATGGEIVADVARYAAQHSQRWGQGLTLLTCAANLDRHLAPPTRYHLLVRAVAQVAQDCSGQPPRRAADPLAGTGHPPARVQAWFRHWVGSRHRDGAERCLLTAITGGSDAAALTAFLFGGALDRLYSNGGHVGDFANKAGELATVLGADGPAELLPLTLDLMASARGGEEAASWQHPVDLVTPLRALALPEPPYGTAAPPPGLRAQLLGHEPVATLAALRDALAGGAAPALVAREVVFAAAWRLAHFAPANDPADWFAPLHTFSFANAVAAAVRRAPGPATLRGLGHAAVAIYLDRQVDVPPAHLPLKEDDLADYPTAADALLDELLAGLDRLADHPRLAGLVARYLRLGHPEAALLDRLVFAAVREDLDFHAVQGLDAAAAQAAAWGAAPERELICIAALRYLAAFCPTPRAAHKTAVIALKLHRGEALHEGA